MVNNGRKSLNDVNLADNDSQMKSGNDYSEKFEEKELVNSDSDGEPLGDLDEKRKRIKLIKQEF